MTDLGKWASSDYVISEADKDAAEETVVPEPTDKDANRDR
jgi:endogenous inhibitor of DNA gyrase (YacG/DUF329 family)